MLAITSN